MCAIGFAGEPAVRPDFARITVRDWLMMVTRRHKQGNGGDVGLRASPGTACSPDLEVSNAA